MEPGMERRRDGRSMGPGLLVALLAILLGSAQAVAQQRVALVVGNSGYARAPSLPNPANDAQDMAERLTALGFKVILRTDAGKAAMDGALVEFARTAANAEIALFYFAGHGMQHQGRNYLLPVDAKIEDELDLRYNLIGLEDVRAALDRVPGARLIILDACRDNPLAERFTRSVAGASRSGSGSRGLARVSQSGGSLVAYATQADDVASDGRGRNSPFTRALLQHIGDRGVEIGTLFRRVAATVNRDTGGRQTPEVSISLLSEVYLNPDPEDVAAWRATQFSQSRADYEDFLARFPESSFAAAARAQIARLGAEPSGPSQVAPVPPGAAQPALTARILAELQRIGCYAGPISATWSARETQAAVANFARQDRIRAPAEPTTNLLEALKLKSDAFCRPTCAKGTVERDGRCVAAKPRPAAARARVTRPEADGSPPAMRRTPPSSRCFVFQGRQYCE